MMTPTAPNTLAMLMSLIGGQTGDDLPELEQQMSAVPPGAMSLGVSPSQPRANPVPNPTAMLAQLAQSRGARPDHKQQAQHGVISAMQDATSVDQMAKLGALTAVNRTTGSWYDHC